MLWKILKDVTRVEESRKATTRKSLVNQDLEGEKELANDQLGNMFQAQGTPALKQEKTHFFKEPQKFVCGGQQGEPRARAGQFSPENHGENLNFYPKGSGNLLLGLPGR
jgi:hypothetical protein